MINETASISILGCAFTMTADTLNKQVFSHLIHTSLKFTIGLLFIVLVRNSDLSNSQENDFVITSRV